MHDSVHVFKNTTALMHGFVQHMKSVLCPAASDRMVSIALSGGSTPLELFHTLRRMYDDTLPWSKILVFWGDERCVALGSSQSNAGTAFRELFTPMNLTTRHIYPMFTGTNTPEEAAALYSQKLLNLLPCSSRGVPVIDLAIQGIGTDGHTASLFPKDIADIPQQKSLCYVTTHPDSRQQRITMSAHLLRHAENIAFLVSGKAKAPIVAQAIKEQKTSSPTLPAACFPRAAWFIDADAGSLFL